MENIMIKNLNKKSRKLSYIALTLISELLGQSLCLPSNAMEKPSSVGVIEKYFDPYSGNIRHHLTQSSLDTYDKKNPLYVIADAQDEDLGDHHANHVTSIIHGASPKSSIRLIDLAYEQGVSIKLGDEAKTIAAIYKAIDSKVDFINLSRRLCPSNDRNGEISEEMRRALLAAKDAGIGVIKSAGNDGEYTGQTAYTNSLYSLLTEMNGSMIMAVALDKDGTDLAWDFSNKAGKAHQYIVAAPGEDILAQGANNKTILMSGTSMAAPHVTGLAAHLKQEYQLPPNQVLDCILQTARIDNPFQTRIFGRGKVDKDGALRRASLLVSSQRESY